MALSKKQAEVAQAIEIIGWVHSSPEATIALLALARHLANRWGSPDFFKKATGLPMAVDRSQWAKHESETG